MPEFHDGEQLYLKCKSSGEVFDSLTEAWRHAINETIDNGEAPEWELVTEGDAF